MAENVRHTVRQGETLATIAAEHGFADSDVVWNAPENAELRAFRKNPHVLMPGDEIVVPAKRIQSVSVATGSRHTFVVKLPRLKLKVRLLDVFGQPRASQEYVAKIGPREEKGTTDGDGNLELKVGASDRTVEVTVGESTYVLSVGELDPAKSRTGVVARLHNLGFGSSFDDLAPGEEEAAFAMLLFLDEQGLDLEAATFQPICDQLEEKHGS